MISVSFADALHAWYSVLKTTTDDPSTFDNAPIAIQLIGRSQEEEAVIGMAEIVDAAIKKQI